MAGAQRGWLEYRAGRRDAARAACEAALAAWTPLWYPLRWPALLPLLASSDEPAPARAWAEALLAADQQRLPDALAASLRDVAGSGRRPWLERRDAAVAVARDLGFL